MGVEPRFGNDGVAPTGRWHACICVVRIQETQTVFTLCFERIDASPFDFLAGQFITIRFTWAEESFSRVFTIASPPTRADRIARHLPGCPQRRNSACVRGISSIVSLSQFEVSA